MRLTIKIGSPLYSKTDDGVTYNDIYYIDRSEIGLSEDVEERNYFIKRILMGKKAKDANYESVHFHNIRFYDDSLYDYINSKRAWNETVGVYYPEEYQNSSTSVPKSQWQSKRIVSYSYVN